MSRSSDQTQVAFVNLMPQEHVANRLQSQCIRRWIAAAISTAFVIGIPGVYISGSAALTDPGLSKQIDQVSSEHTQNEQIIPLLQNRLQALIAEQQVHDLVRNRVDWGGVFSLLVESAGNQVRFRQLAAVGGGVEGKDAIEIRVVGLAPSQTIARAYLVDLENLGVFDIVELAGTSREQIGDFELIAFEVLIVVNAESVDSGEEPNDG